MHNRSRVSALSALVEGEMGWMMLMLAVNDSEHVVVVVAVEYVDEHHDTQQ